MGILARTLVSEREFLQLPESMDRSELLDGEVIVSPAPTPWHQELVRRLLVALSNWVSQQALDWHVGLSPTDVRFAPGRILQPDLFVIRGAVPLVKGPIEQVPDLCVEVISDRVLDRVTRRMVYAAAGVRELWLIEQGGLVERRTGSGLEVAEELTDRLSTPLLPGFELDLRELFRGAPR